MAKEFNTEEFGQLANTCLTRLKDFFSLANSGTHTSSELAEAKLASALLSSYTRHIQTHGAHEAAMIMMAREIADDKGHLRKILGMVLTGKHVTLALKE